MRHHNLIQPAAHIFEEIDFDMKCLSLTFTVPALTSLGLSTRTTWLKIQKLFSTTLLAAPYGETTPCQKSPTSSSPFRL